jgi:hydrogenase expression/formation protein HypD
MNDCIRDIASLSEKVGRPVKFMEVCGTHTMAAFRTGLRSLLPDGVSLLSGPGCPVCVTPKPYLDRAIAIARQTDVIICSFGDMLRVPGTESSLERVRAEGGDIRVVYSPLDALQMAVGNPERRVVFLGVGFETTTPTVAWTMIKAKHDGVSNFSVLCAHKTIPEAMAGLLAAGEAGIDGFLCPGHVSVIIGSQAYEGLCSTHKAPCVVAGFEAMDMAKGIEMLLAQVADGRAEVEVEYTRSVDASGNAQAREFCESVFEKGDLEWRGLGVVPDSGLKIRSEYADHDAEQIFKDLKIPVSKGDGACRCGEVLRGIRLPTECELFARECEPTNPIGACMVSSEGTCAAYYKYAERE